ncbi:MAG: hypothetical protein JWO26_2582 [Rhodospirillales bacterium]|jgi:uncharacterized membrane protein YkvA (DUF1232 family)|nr:hypothetical protein [Rhodospirillales bacterium]
MRRWLSRARGWASRVKRDVVALWLAARDRRTPLAAKLASAAVATYALSPIDLIPDAIPVLGYLDDLLIVPLGVMLAVRLVPPLLMVEFRAQALARSSRPVSRAGLAIVIAAWLLMATGLAWWLWPHE